MPLSRSHVTTCPPRCNIIRIFNPTDFNQRSAQPYIGYGQAPKPTKLYSKLVSWASLTGNNCTNEIGPGNIIPDLRPQIFYPKIFWPKYF